MKQRETIREKSLEWFFSKTRDEKIALKDKHFSTVPIRYDSHWGFHFTFGQIEEMYKKEIKVDPSLLTTEHE